MTPGEFRNGGANLQIQYLISACRFGNYIVASTGKGICNLAFFEGSKHSPVENLQQDWPGARLQQGTDPHLRAVQQFFEMDTADMSAIKLHLRASAFQLKVWQALLQIPLGDVTSYGSIAAQLHQPKAARAVGTAIGSNPVAFLIPCHRVIKNLGETGGYRWGPLRKKIMLGWEAANAAVFAGETQ